MNVKKTIFLLTVFAFVPIFAGCTLFEEEVIERDVETPAITAEQSRLEYSHEIEGVTIVTSYHLGDYSIEKWKITDSKSINFLVEVSDNPNQSEILVEHVHADLTIKATDPQLNGLTQDSMDNSYHGNTQDGFLINEKYSYENIFAVEGFSKDIISGWGFYTGTYGTSHLSSSRLTEKNLIKQGAYASNLEIVWNFLVKHKDDSKYHVVSVKDSVLIPVNLEQEIDSSDSLTTDSSQAKE